ncbi:hypothetical protein Q9R32_16730, partial [Actinotalea sp. AC32]|nr:hypothetical protein [Actinotalea sp. AC32]
MLEIFSLRPARPGSSTSLPHPARSRALAVLTLSLLAALVAAPATALTAAAAPTTSVGVPTTSVGVPTTDVAESTAATGAAYRAVAPRRVVSGQGIGAGKTVTIRIPDVPAGATAVQLNVTASRASAVSYMSLCAAGTPLADCRATSALNPRPGIDTPGSAVVALGGAAGDQVTVYNNAGSLRFSVDVHGFYVPPTTTDGVFTSRVPSRALDRTFGSREWQTLTLRDVPVGATAVAVNVTSSRFSTVSYVSACPAGQDRAVCSGSSVNNAAPGIDRANAAVVKLGGTSSNQIQVYNNAGPGRVVVDVTGFFVKGGSAGKGTYVPVAPQRAMSFQPMSAGQTRTLTAPAVPAGAKAAVVNVTTTRTTGTSYLSACPAGTALASCKAASVKNPAAGRDIANSAMLKLGGSRGDQITFYNNAASTSLIVDVVGYFVGEAPVTGTVPNPPAPAPAPATTSAKPDASNTGVRPGSDLRVHRG